MNYDISSILAYEMYGNTVREIFWATGVFFVGFFGLLIVESFVFARLKALFKRTKTKVDDKVLAHIRSVGTLTYASIALYIAVRQLILPEMLRTVIRAFVLIMIVYESVRILQKVVEFFVTKKLEKTAQQDGEQVVLLLRPIINGVLWAIALLMILSNLGVDVTSLITGLGIGGVAIALAVQNILGDIFNSITIYLDKPFKVGDFIVIGQHMGTVKKIGIKSTRLTALGGEELVISNHELTSARVQNFKRMERRRILFTIGVTYATPPTKLRKIGKICKDIIDKQKNVDFDRAHFKAFDDSSLTCEIVYYINSAEYNDYMDAQQKINISILEEFAKEDIEMAFPTRTMHVINEDQDYEFVKPKNKKR